MSRLACSLFVGAVPLWGYLLAADANSGGPWRVSPAARLPEWLELSGAQRTRGETLDGQFRAGRSGGDQMLAFRTTLRLEAKSERGGLVGEMVQNVPNAAFRSDTAYGYLALELTS